MNSADLGIPVFCAELEKMLQENLPQTDMEMQSFRKTIRGMSQRLKACKEKYDRIHRESNLNSDEMLAYFRSMERYRLQGFLLDYLVCFLDGLPDEEAVKREPADPFNQFKEFTENLIAQLEDNDVRSAALFSLNANGQLDDSNHWYYNGRMDFMVRKLRERLSQANSPRLDHWKTLFSVLCDYCRFWFSLRNGDPKRIRSGDAAIYQLTTLLMEKISLQEAAT